jgi:hypothetical protein
MADIESNLPNVTPKPGWQTSEGQITAIVSFIFTALAVVGYHFSPDTTNNVYDLIHQIFVILVPVMGVVLPLIAYIRSRGIQKSNAINATAAMVMSPSEFPTPVPLAGGLGSLLGGKSWKDPSRYINIVKDIASTGLIPGPAGSVLGKIGGAVSGSEDEFHQEVVNALQALDARLKALEAK